MYDEVEKFWRGNLLLQSAIYFTLEVAMKTQRESRGTALLFIQTRRQMGVDGQYHPHLALRLEKE